MICDEDPLRRRPRESTARRKRQERCVWMARKMTEWPSKRGPITKIMPSDGCIGDTVPLAVGKWYEFHEFGWHMGNVALSKHEDPVAYCSAARKHLEGLDDADALMAFWARNQDTVGHLRTNLPDLKTEKGQHYGEILGNLYTVRLQEFAARKAKPGKTPENSEDSVDEPSTPRNVKRKTQNARPQRIEKKQPNSTEKGPRRVRDPEHLKFVASLELRGMRSQPQPSPSHPLRPATGPRPQGKR